MLTKIVKQNKCTKTFFLDLDDTEENQEEDDEEFVPAFSMDQADQANQDEAQGIQGKNCN